MHDLITIGVVTLDTFLKIHDANIRCKIKKEDCEFCFSYADKIAVDELHQTLGGNGANNAVGASRLGLKTSIYTLYGNDQIGDLIQTTFGQEGVGLEYALRESGNKSDMATVINFQAERTIFVYHEKRSYKLPQFENSKWVYYTSLMKGFEAVHKPLVNYLKQSGAKLAFNPGTHQLLAGKEAIKEILEVTDVLIVNKEESQRILEDNDKDVKYLLKGLHHLGPKTVVITDGDNGSFTFDGISFLKIGIFDGPVIERTGCGDSYSTGFLASLINGGNMADAMVWGTFNGWSVVQKIGPQAGLLYKEQMQKLVKENPSFRPKVF